MLNQGPNTYSLKLLEPDNHKMAGKRHGSPAKVSLDE